MFQYHAVSLKCFNIIFKSLEYRTLKHCQIFTYPLHTPLSREEIERKCEQRFIQEIKSSNEI